jgi:two-component system sensor histidine kinase KdpD
VVDKIIRQSHGISVHVIPGEFKQARGSKESDKRSTQKISIFTYIGAILMTVLLTILAAPLKEILGLVNIVMLYLLPILFSAVNWGTYPAVVTALTGVLTFDFFLVSPVRSFTVADIRYVVTFVILLVVALFTSRLSTRLRQQIVLSRHRESRISALYSLSREIAAISDLKPVMQSIVDKVAETIEGQVTLLLPDKNGDLTQIVVSSFQGGAFLDDNERAVVIPLYSQQKDVATLLFIHLSI